MVNRNARGHRAGCLCSETWESHDQSTRLIFDGRLSKRVLFSLPAGAYVVSNCFLVAPRVPIIARHISDDLEDRDELWRESRSMGLAGRLFRAFGGACESSANVSAVEDERAA